MEEFGAATGDFSVEMGDFKIKKSRKFNRTIDVKPGGSVTTGVIPYEGLLYFASANKNVYAVEPADGTLVWKYRTEGVIMESNPCIVDGILYEASYDRHIHAVDAKTGELIWKYETSDKVLSSPIVSDGIVYCGSVDRNMYALDAKSGSLIWKFTTYDWVISDATVIGDKLIFGSHDRFAYCLNKKTGELIWKIETQGEVFNNGLFAHRDGIVYIASLDNNLRAIELDTGRIIWKKKLSTYGMISTGAIHGDILLQPLRDGLLLGLDINDGSVRWKFDSRVNDVMGQPLVHDNKIYIGNYGSHLLYCVDLEGKELWKFKAFDGIYASPHIIDGNLVFASWDCNVYCMDIETRLIKWKFRADGSPVVLPPPYEAFELQTSISEGEFEETKRKSYEFEFEGSEERDTSEYKSTITYQSGTTYREKGKYQVDSREEEF